MREATCVQDLDALVRLALDVAERRATGWLIARSQPSSTSVHRVRVVAGRAEVDGPDPLGRRVLRELDALTEHASVRFVDGEASTLGARSSVELARWARGLVERSLRHDEALEIEAWSRDASLKLTRPLPSEALLDVLDERLARALTQPCSARELGPRCRVSRYRIAAFLKFARLANCLGGAGARDDREAPTELFGLRGEPDLREIKHAFRTRARALHPDLHPNASGARRRELELELGRLNAAYAAICAGAR
ncbi:MAG: J domain-containing protein [Polyangiaceae bacterium]